MTKARDLARVASNAEYGLNFRNRIINGDMRIDQRNAGASVTPANADYTLDRFQTTLSQTSKYSVQRSTTAPAGFKNSMLVTSLSAYTVGSAENFTISHGIEGFNVADLGWGTADAKTVTLSFWVRSSLTGTFGGAINNEANNRSYPFSYSISAANTFEFKTVTIAGDTTGTWESGSNCGIRVRFGLGVGSTLSGTAGSWSGTALRSATGATSLVGTNGATFYLTGVQLEVGSGATPFESRPYGTELALCQRYYVDLANNGGAAQNTYRAIGFCATYTTTQGTYVVQVPVPMRALPSLTQAGVMYLQNLGTTSVSGFGGPYSMAGTIIEGDFSMAGAVTANITAILRWNNTSTQRFAYSAEL